MQYAVDLEFELEEQELDAAVDALQSVAPGVTYTLTELPSGTAYTFTHADALVVLQVAEYYDRNFSIYSDPTTDALYKI